MLYINYISIKNEAGDKKSSWESSKQLSSLEQEKQRAPGEWSLVRIDGVIELEKELRLGLRQAMPKKGGGSRKW